MQAVQQSVQIPSAVFLLDDLPMRRAEIDSFLRPWSETMEVSLLSEALAGPLDLDWVRRHGRMIIASLGATPFVQADSLRDILGQLDRGAAMPVVILSDNADSQEIASAFEAGVRGFIPSSTEPEVALRALTFILNGGHFFPPTALMLPSTRFWGKAPPDEGSNAGPIVVPAEMVPDLPRNDPTAFVAGGWLREGVVIRKGTSARHRPAARRAAGPRSLRVRISFPGSYGQGQR